jgi:phosphinothricin acetyltransferase
LIRPATPDDAAAIARIYEHYVRNTVATFEEEPVPVAEIASRIDRVGRLGLPFLVVTTEDAGGAGDPPLGYAYANRWRERSAYRHTVETSIYLDPDHTGQGFGTRLYATLLETLRERGLHVAIGGITLPNPGSVALHEKLGFRIAAQFHEVGFKFGEWLDVGYWQLAL